MTNNQKWLKTLRWLRHEFPAQRRVVVRSVEIKDCCGYISLHRECFFIRVDKLLPDFVRLDTIIHEWAHALAWFSADQEEDHSDEWGLSYARIYRAWVKWNFGRKETCT